MAIASTPTKLPLWRWARIVGIHPLHFAQIAYTPNYRSPALCDSALFQYSWQTADRVAREDIANAIAEAEELIERRLQFRLIPSWERDEWHTVPRPYRPELATAFGRDIRGYPSAMRATWGHVLTGGVEARSLVQAGAAIVWTDTDNDGYFETGTVVVTMPPSAVTCEIEAYYPGRDGQPQFQIRPCVVSYDSASGDATLTLRRETCVQIELMESMSASVVIATEDASFLSTVDVYRHYNDPSTQVTLMWDPTGCPMCGQQGCVLCSYTVQTGCLLLRSDPKTAVFGWSPGVWNVTTRTFDEAELSLSRGPDLARLYYYAGLSRPLGCPRDMDDAWARAVTYLSLSLLERPICDCTNDTWAFWRMEMAGKGNNEESADVFVSSLDLPAPFGTRRGAIYAWNRIKDPDVAAVRSTMLV